MMTREDVLRLLHELDDFEVRLVALARRLPDDAAVAELRQDVTRRRQAVVQALALYAEIDAFRAYEAAPRH